MDGPFLIEVTRSLEPCWLSGERGDPGRTTRAIQARRWEHRVQAEEELLEARHGFPRRQFEITTLATAQEKERAHAAEMKRLHEQRQ